MDYNKAKEWYNIAKQQDNALAIEILERQFPELKESEDERMKKSFIRLIKAYYDVNFPTSEGFTREEMIAWLEKQGEQNPAWSEEDERMCQETIDWFEKKCFPYALESENPARESIKWLKSLKDKVQPQPQREWSEEDKKMLKSLICTIEANKCHFSNTSELKEVYDGYLSWLKSLKPQKQEWTEEDESMLKEIIGSVTACDATTGTISVCPEKHEAKINWLKSKFNI